MPSKPGVYQFLDAKNKILYVGKANDLKSRVSSYFVNDSLLGLKTKVLVGQIEKIKIVVVESELEALLLEAFYIKKFKPRYNVKMADSKTYPYIQINIKDKHPSIFLTRRMDDSKSLYFGPYPNTGAIKLILKTLRKVFPYQSARNHPKKVCLYNHLGLCPCLPVSDNKDNLKHYKSDIRSIVRVLEGETQKLLKEYKKARDLFSKNEEFEKAKETQKKIDALKIITEQSRPAIEYDLNPNLRTDLRQSELNELSNILSSNGCKAGKIKKIECYDISNIQGKHSVGSMVVFIDGEKENSLYRKFKIKRENTPDDFASMEEVLTRRLRHLEWNYPDLIIVDGGKGQVTAALRAFTMSNVSIPLIGLAKREETIVIPQIINSNTEFQNSKQIQNTNIKNQNVVSDFEFRASDFIEVSLPKNAKALHLLMRIRDEAHRFAITYHKKLRSKANFG